MKVSKKLLKTITLALAVSTVGACKKNTINPKDSVKKSGKTDQTENVDQWDNCPACGMG